MFIGDKEIESTEELSGSVKVLFKDRSTLVLRKKMFDASLSLVTLDLTQLQERRIVAVQHEFMELLLDWGIKLADMPRLLQWTANYLQQRHETASDKLWGNHYDERTITDLNDVLFKDLRRGSSSPTTSEGIGSDSGNKG